MVEVPDVLELTAPQARVLGSLLEKQATTPDSYPMTLNALTTACNQSSNRDPVVDYGSQLVETTLLAMKGKGLARIVHPGAGERSTKYRHIADEALGLDTAQRAVVCVLLLRGPQTVAELKTRTERMHRFESLADIESTLADLAAHEHTLVAQVDRQPGQKEPRWIELLQEGAEERAAALPSATISASSRSGRVEELEARVDTLERRVAQLVEALDDLVELPPE
ncbi:MAG: DUF480 domain-containing protein [Acidimicrobiia bacterium]|nr:DUF480 domain-containing protein [Acidimicrobiia bacterium]